MASSQPQVGADATTIAGTTIACRENLKRCTEIEALNHHNWAENRLADFNIWDSGLAACSNGQASLENRLVPKPQIRTAVLSLLLLYEQSVDLCIELGFLHDERDKLNRGSELADNASMDDPNLIPKSSIQDSELTVYDSTLLEAIEDADLVLNDLARLAVLIRKAGTTARLSKADKTFDPRAEKHNDLRAHLYQVLVSQPSWLEGRRHEYWREKDPGLLGISKADGDTTWACADQNAITFSYDEREFTQVQRRLVEANLRRSHRFAYSQRHSRKLETLSQLPNNEKSQRSSSIGNSSPKWTVPLDPNVNHPDKKQQAHSDNRPTPNEVAKAMTDTAASDVDSNVIGDVARLPTPSQQAVTEVSTTGSRIRYPQPPPFGKGATIFNCPCCCIPLPVVFAESRRWKNHIREDILPYVCVLPNCPQPDTLFAQKTAWLQHMFSQHTTTIGWGCEICGDEETFCREADLVEHLADIHLDSIPRDDLDLFVDMGAKQSVEGLSSCPVCSWTPGVEGVVSNDQLIDHVAEHIHSFALRSLPWAPDKIDYSQSTFKSSIEKVETWFSACNPGAETFEHTPTLQTQGSHSNRDNYFDKHEYFAESSKASSDAATLSGFSNHDDSDEDESSIRMVKDLGFGAAASNLPAIFNTPGEYDAEISDSLKAVFEKRKSRHSSQSQKTSGTTHILLNLQKEIEDELEWSQHDHKEFLPLQSFEGIFNPRTIALLLDQTYHFATHKELENKFASIMNRKSGRSRRRTLAVLVLMSKVAHIEDFIREDIWDDDLPVEHLAENAKGYVVTRTSDNDKLMNTWSRPDINLFCSYQKIFFVPFFDMRADRLCFYELQSNIRLPWMVFQHKTNGGFGVVHRVEIHPDHHNFPVSNSRLQPVFALKIIEAANHKAYEDELAALQKTRAQVHKEKHLIKLLLTFQHGDKFFLLFEWADGNLEEFWKLHPTRPATLLGESWAAKQCLGLARAVSEIHGLTTWQKIGRSSSFEAFDYGERDWGRHGDIKPENILWFQEYETDHDLLVISNFELTRYHSQFSKTFVPRTQIDGCSWAYRPPELDMEERISQKYDIWSLGCVFLEFAVWYLQGHYEVETFGFQRIDEDLATYDGVKIEKFFNIQKSEDGRKEPHLKQVVKDRLRELNHLSNATTFTKGLLYVIEHKMLQCAPDERGQIDVICVELSNILESIQQVGDTDDVAQGLRSRLSQDLAHIRRDDSAPSLHASRSILSLEVLRESLTDDQDLLLGDVDDPGLLMRKRSQRLRRDNGGTSESRRDPAPRTDRQGISGLYGASTIAGTTRKIRRDQSAKKDAGSERAEQPGGDTDSPHESSQAPSTGETNKVERRGISRWFRDTIKQVRPGRK